MIHKRSSGLNIIKGFCSIGVSQPKIAVHLAIIFPKATHAAYTQTLLIGLYRKHRHLQVGTQRADLVEIEQETYSQKLIFLSLFASNTIWMLVYMMTKDVR